MRGGPGKAKRGAEVLPSDAFALFHDIEVQPGDAFRLRSILLNGGPVWPRFRRQTAVRFVWRGTYVDDPVEPSAGPHEVVDQPCLWGGYAIPHFGHLIADHLTRVLAGRMHRPDDLMLFLRRPGDADAPGYFWDLMDWYGVPRGQVRFVTGPLRVRELRCFAQAEPFGSWPPDDRYLDMLAQNAVRVEPVVAPLVYVGRMGMPALGKGGVAGESYLVQVLHRLGVAVLDPARAPLAAQMAAYAGAGVLVFAEGSAVHGRQLLGRLDQKVVVLNRRLGARIAEAALRARARDVTYVEATARVIAMGTLAGMQSAQGLSLYDLDAVLAAFAQHGVDLAAVWDTDAYQAAVLADAESWLTTLMTRERAILFDLTMAAEGLREAGVPVNIAGLG